MDNIYDLLNISLPNLTGFSKLANGIVTSQSIKNLESNLKRLDHIADMSNFEDSYVVNQNSAGKVIGMVLENVRLKKDKNILSSIDLRILSHSISNLIDNENAFNYAMSLLEGRWRNLYFSGLVFFVISYWYSIPRNCRSSVCDLITRKLLAYDGTFKRYQILKNHVNYFEENGPLRLAALIKSRSLEIEKAPEVLGLKSSSITGEFFSDVIVRYFQGIATPDYAEVENILLVHHSQRTSLLVISDMIIAADKSNNAFAQSQICRFAAKILKGDLRLSNTWAPFKDATQAEKDKLTKARELVYRWFTKRVIETFFDVCVMDPRRKAYWLRYIAYVKDFMLFGPSTKKYRLFSDSRLSGVNPNCFRETISNAGDTVCLALQIGNKWFLEFSDVGSLYVYNQDNAIIRYMVARRIENLSRLKDVGKANLFTKNAAGTISVFAEGSLRHQGSWEERLDVWFKTIMKIKVY